MPLQSFVGEDTSRADFHEVAAELVFQHAVGLATEIDLIPQSKHIKIPASGIFAVKTHAAITLDAAVHFVVHQRTQILIAESAFEEGVPAMVMTSHHSHVLKMTVSTLVADWTIVRVVDHHALNDPSSEGDCLWILD